MTGCDSLTDSKVWMEEVGGNVIMFPVYFDDSSSGVCPGLFF